MRQAERIEIAAYELPTRADPTGRQFAFQLNYEPGAIAILSKWEKHGPCWQCFQRRLIGNARSVSQVECTGYHQAAGSHRRNFGGRHGSIGRRCRRFRWGRRVAGPSDICCLSFDNRGCSDQRLDFFRAECGGWHRVHEPREIASGQQEQKCCLTPESDWNSG